jgi:DNA-binding response OmpR family regulator
MNLIFYIDDDEGARIWFSRIVTHFGYEVITARDVEEGFPLLLDRPPSILFVDIGLPGESGLELARMVRETPGLEDCIIVALTAATGQNEQARFLEVCDHYLSKPVNGATLRTTIETLLQDR